MILVMDTGNTNIVLGVYEQGQLKSSLAYGNISS